MIQQRSAGFTIVLHSCSELNSEIEIGTTKEKRNISRL
jgi:hypothetical protein